MPHSLICAYTNLRNNFIKSNYCYTFLGAIKKLSKRHINSAMRHIDNDCTYMYIFLLITKKNNKQTKKQQKKKKKRKKREKEKIKRNV